jgi:hypothetical protein
MWTWVTVGVVIVGLAAWPLLHGALLAEGVRVLTGKRAETGRIVGAVLGVPLMVFLAQLGTGCCGVSAGGSLVAGATWLALGLAARSVAYAAILRLPAAGAFGLGLGVQVVGTAYGSVLVALASASLWAGGVIRFG